MRRGPTTTDHAEAVSRRLASLSAELAAVRGETPTHTRLRGGPEDQEAPLPVVVPVPGRHASRRLADRLGPAHLAVVVVVVAAAVALAAWAALRGQATPVPVTEVAEAPTALAAVPSTAGEPPPGTSDGTASGDAAAAGEAAGEAGGEGAGEVTVDVAGKVRRPGIAVLPAGSRVVDALEAAGGTLRGVDLTSLNLARPLVDGEQVLVGVSPPPGVAGTLGEPGGAGPDGALVNLNTADQALLETLPGVGPVTATAILDWRTEHGGFSSVDELLEVDGIGEATLADLAPLVTI